MWGHTLRDSMKTKGLPPHLYKSGGRWRRDNAIEEIKRLDMLLEYAVQPFPHLYKCGNGGAVRDRGV